VVTYGTSVVIVGLLVCILVTVRGPEVDLGAVVTVVVEIAAVPGTVKTVSVLVSQSEVFDGRCDDAAKGVGDPVIELGLNGMLAMGGGGLFDSELNACDRMAGAPPVAELEAGAVEQ
jgi:hypothetical protein